MNEAIGSADIVFVMLTDVQAVETAMLHREDVVRALAGKIVVNAVSKASSEAVLQAENFLNGGVAAYVDMAMLCGPKEIGSPECLQLLAGPEASIAAVQEIVAVIGTPFPTGTSYGVAAAFDAGVLSSFFGAALGYMHGMAYVQAEGGDTSAFHNVVTSALPALLPVGGWGAGLISAICFPDSGSPDLLWRVQECYCQEHGRGLRRVGGSSTSNQHHTKLYPHPLSGLPRGGGVVCDAASEPHRVPGRQQELPAYDAQGVQLSRRHGPGH